MKASRPESFLHLSCELENNHHYLCFSEPSAASAGALDDLGILLEAFGTSKRSDQPWFSY